MVFKKAVQFTDIHLGLKGNSKEHNNLCIEYINWLITESKEFGAETCIFNGDLFHQRNAINVLTFDYGIKLMELLSQNFEKVYLVVGNHDLFYRTSRNVHSLGFAKKYSNIHVVDEITKIDDCLFLPFLVKDEHKNLDLTNVKYVFGHLELPGYMLNNMIQMPDTGKETDEMFNTCEYVFSGHFHKRQVKTLKSGTEIHYIGNTFPHNFSDSWDDKRGLVLLEYNSAPIYRDWDDCPKYKDGQLSAILQDHEYYCGYRTTLKANLDMDISIEDINFIREIFKQKYNMTDFIIRGGNMSVDGIVDEECEILSVDQVVNAQLEKLETTFNKNLLIDIYNSL